MTLKKLILSSVAALSLIGTSVYAADNSKGTAIATDGTGDYLVFPYYAAVGSWKTNIRVVNSNPTDAIVAKVVIREWKTSAEKLDFPIYLTPGDVWEATLTLENGKVVLKCNDDSMIVKGTPASVNPVSVALFPEEGAQDNHYGYVEVFGVGQISAGAVQDMDNDGITWGGVGKPLDKDDLYAYYKSTLHAGNNPGDVWKGVDTDSLYGQEILFAKNQYGNLAMTLAATALEGVTGKNANAQQIIAADTTPDNVIIPDAGTTLNKVLGNVAEALRKKHVYATYYDNGGNGVAETALILTQPMKKYLYPAGLSAIGYNYKDADGNAATKSPLDYYFKYSTVARDMKEHTNIEVNEFSGGKPVIHTCNTEICMFDAANYTGSFTNGYVDFDLSGNKIWANKQSGIHAIPVLMTAKNVEGTNVTNVITPAYKK